MNRDEQVLKNLDRVEGFLHDIIDQPKLLGNIRDGSTIVLVPGDDRELGDANMAVAREMIHGCPKCSSQLRPSDANSAPRAGGGVYLQAVCP